MNSGVYAPAVGEVVSLSIIGNTWYPRCTGSGIYVKSGERCRVNGNIDGQGVFTTGSCLNDVLNGVCGIEGV